jgi:hypothetical protein
MPGTVGVGFLLTAAGFRSSLRQRDSLNSAPPAHPPLAEKSTHPVTSKMKNPRGNRGFVLYRGLDILSAEDWMRVLFVGESGYLFTGQGKTALVSPMIFQMPAYVSYSNKSDKRAPSFKRKEDIHVFACRWFPGFTSRACVRVEPVLPRRR